MKKDIEGLKHCPFCDFTEEEYIAYAERMRKAGMSYAKEDIWPMIYKDRFLNKWVIECQNCGTETILNEIEKEECIKKWNEVKR